MGAVATLPLTAAAEMRRAIRRERRREATIYPRAARSFSFCALIDSRAWFQSASDQSRN